MSSSLFICSPRKPTYGRQNPPVIPSKGPKGKKERGTNGKGVRWMAGCSPEEKYQDRWKPEIDRNAAWAPSAPPYRESSDPAAKEAAGSEPFPGASA